MDADDRQLGHILSRRELLALLGATGTTLLVGCGPSAPVAETTPTTLNAEARTVVALEANPTAQASTAAEATTAEVANTAVAVPSCVVRPEVTEGPYYLAADLLRSDVRADSATGAVQPGAPLLLTFQVSQVSAGSCTPLPDATVEIWHCNTSGQYSGVSDPSFDTSNQDWLRGAQRTDANGVASFTTIYPGWYPGRAVHIHFKVSPSANTVFTSQLFFDEALTDQVFAQEPYAAAGQRDTNSTDGIFQELLLVNAAPSADGYSATFAIGIDPTTTGSGSQGGGPGGGLGGPPPGRP